MPDAPPDAAPPSGDAPADVHITLNVRYDWPEDQLEVFHRVLEEADGWLGEDVEACCVRWFGPEGAPRHLWGSLEPAGFLIAGRLEPDRWAAWLSTLCATLSARLGRPVHDVTA